MNLLSFINVNVKMIYFVDVAMASRLMAVNSVSCRELGQNYDILDFIDNP